MVGRKFKSPGHRIKSKRIPNVPAAAISWLSVREDMKRPMAMYTPVSYTHLTFDAIDTVKGCLALFTGMISTMSFRRDVMEASAKNGFTNATDAADYLVGKGVPFRDAHGIVGQLVLLCIQKGIALDDLSLEEYRQISPVFEEDVYDAISMKTCVEKRITIGAPGQEAMKQVIGIYKKMLAE